MAEQLNIQKTKSLDIVAFSYYLLKSYATLNSSFRQAKICSVLEITTQHYSKGLLVPHHRQSLNRASAFTFPRDGLASYATLVKRI